jgi:hypothetical protein
MFDSFQSDVKTLIGQENAAKSGAAKALLGNRHIRVKVSKTALLVNPFLDAIYRNFCSGGSFRKLDEEPAIWPVDVNNEFDKWAFHGYHSPRRPPRRFKVREARVAAISDVGEFWKRARAARSVRRRTG